MLVRLACCTSPTRPPKPTQIHLDSLLLTGILNTKRLAANYGPHDLSNEKSTTHLFMQYGAYMDKSCVRLVSTNNISDAMSSPKGSRPMVVAHQLAVAESV